MFSLNLDEFSEGLTWFVLDKEKKVYKEAYLVRSLQYDGRSEAFIWNLMLRKISRFTIRN